MRTTATAHPAYAWFVVILLMLAYLLSFVDRQILSLLVAPIRRDLGIGDTQMSLLLGLSFALFYTLCGIPLARWADTRSRRGLIVFGVLAWSVATALCGLAQRYVHMLLARIGVGVGEAALSPAAYSLIADYFPRERRATAISVYSNDDRDGGNWRMEMDRQQASHHAGRGPRDYVRPDERISEDIARRLTDDDMLDASDIAVRVVDGIAILQGSVDSRRMKRRAEGIADACSGVRDVRNEIGIRGISDSSAQASCVADKRTTSPPPTPTATAAERSERGPGNR